MGWSDVAEEAGRNGLGVYVGMVVGLFQNADLFGADPRRMRPGVVTGTQARGAYVGKATSGPMASGQPAGARRACPLFD